MPERTLGVVQDLVLISAAVRLISQENLCLEAIKGSSLTRECVFVELLDILPCESFPFTA